MAASHSAKWGSDKCNRRKLKLILKSTKDDKRFVNHFS